MKQIQLTLFADYSQFYIQDEAAAGDLSQAWNDETTERLLTVAPGIVGIGTVRNMSVPVTVEMHAAEPDDDSADWDQVIEASLHVASGTLVIAGCTDYLPDAQRIEARPDTYRVRVSYGALDTISENGLSGDDHYRLQLWAAPAIEVRVLKHRAK